MYSTIYTGEDLKWDILIHQGFNVETELAGKYCSKHKSVNMIDVKHKRCEFDGCMNQPSYKFETDTSCRYCSTHKLEGMSNGKHAFCMFEGCKTSAGYNIKGNKTPVYCGVHKKEGMVDVKHTICIENGCDKRSIFHYEGNKQGLYCFMHKKENMINISSPRCKADFCYNFSMKKYDYYCMNCYIHLFPDKPNSRNYKTKEKAVVDFILNEFGSFSWICDKKIADGCSRLRPDLLLDIGSHIIIVEIDENQHANYDCSCDNKRLMELSQDVGHRPIIFIRFNPDSYISEKTEKIRSCWIPNKSSGILHVPKSRMDEWNKRLNILCDQIIYWLQNTSDKTIEIIQLFYDGMAYI